MKTSTASDTATSTSVARPRTAADTRRVLASVAADWWAAEGIPAARDEADIALEAALITTGTINGYDVVESIHEHESDIWVMLESGEALGIDLHGNILRGAAE